MENCHNETLGYKQIPIRHVDVLVHPDFNAHSKDPISDFSRLHLRYKWQNRVRELSARDDCALFYYSHFISFSEDLESSSSKTQLLDLNNPELLDLEKVRIKMYRKLLGNRLVVLAGRCEPRSYQSRIVVDRHNLSFNPEVSVLAYGEYFDRCVQLWGRAATHILWESETTLSFSKGLSLASYQVMQKQ